VQTISPTVKIANHQFSYYGHAKIEGITPGQFFSGLQSRNLGGNRPAIRDLVTYWEFSEVMSRGTNLAEALPMAVEQGRGVERHLPRRREFSPERSAYALALATSHGMTPLVHREVTALRIDWNRLVGLGSLSMQNLTAPIESIAKLVSAKPSRPSDWLEANAHSVEMYAGEWLLITTEGLVAHNASYAKIRAVLQQNRPAEYMTHYVPKADEANFRL
jgi:hypothetical protein